MAKETFMLVSLKEDKAQKLAQVISNPTCRKILDHLALKEVSETDIAKELNIPLSTVHYNLSQLKESKLVETEEFHYSKKGKEILHYKLANKYIIIAPKDASSSFLESLKTLIPVTTIIAAGLGFWQYIARLQPTTVQDAVGVAVQEGASEVGSTPAMFAKSAADVAAPAFAAVPPAGSVPVEATVQTITTVAQTAQPLWMYVAYGAFCALVLYVAVDQIRKRL